MHNHQASRWILLGLALLAMSNWSFADPVIYNYTGPNFIGSGNVAGPAYPEFFNSTFVTATVTLDEAISSEGGPTDYASHVLSFSLTAGDFTVTNGPNTVLNDMLFQTSNGLIVGWDIDASLTPDYENTIGLAYTDIRTTNFIWGPLEPYGLPLIEDAATVIPLTFHGDYTIQNFGYVQIMPDSAEGSWATAPEPATILMLSAGLALLARKRVQ